MTAGLVACVAALAVASAIGVAWRATNGKMRRPSPARHGAAAQPGAALRDAVQPVAAQPGGAQPVAAQPGGAQPDAARASVGDQNDAAQPAAASLAEAGAPRVAATQIGQPLGERATLLQFSSAFCAPCRATRRILGEVAGMTEGVAHIEIDAEDRLDLVRALRVLRTPTVLVLAADGRIVRRASGQPRKADVIGALGEAVADDVSYSSGLEAR